MLRLIALLFAGGIAGTVFGFALGIFLYPYIFLADIVAEETADAAAGRQVLARGAFVHADPADPVHYGSGGVTVYNGLLRLEPDFDVGPGPKFHVYLTPKAPVTTEADVEGTMFVDLGRLRAFKGSQNFTIPAGIDIKKFGSVVIWCEQFGVLISPATLSYEN